MRIKDTRLPKFEVTVISKMRCEMKKEVSAINEYEAVMEMADYLARNFDFYHHDSDYEVVKVVKVLRLLRWIKEKFI